MRILRKIAFLVLMMNTLMAWGPRSHIETVRLASAAIQNDIFPGLTDLYTTNLGAFCAGSNFPDWALGVLGPTWSYHAHSMEFAELYLQILLDSFPDFSSAEAKRELAFLLGVNAHIYADRVWHSYHTPPGMTGALTMAMSQDGRSEDVIEGALDIIIAYEFPEPSFSWYWPLETIRRVYHAFGDTDVTISDLNTGAIGLETAYSTVLTGSGYLSYISSKSMIPWTYNNYQNYYPGGLKHAMQISVSHWRRIWAKAALGADYYQRSEHECGYVATDDLHLLASSPGNNCGGENIVSIGTGDETGRGLFYWDISSFDTTRRIDSAKVYLKYTSGSPAGSKTIEAFRVNRPWGEGIGADGSETTYNGSAATSGTACWTHARYSTEPWAVPGADGSPEDREASELSSRAFTSGTTINRWQAWNITLAVNSWANRSANNYGILFRETGAGGAILFPSGENKSVSERPALIIYSSLIPVSITECAMPESYAISAYPNPFNSEVKITIDGVGAGLAPALVEIFDLAGRRVAELPRLASLGTPSQAKGKSPLLKEGWPEAGVFLSDGARPSPTTCEFTWSPDETLPSGVYLVRANTNGKSALTRIVFLK